MQEMIDITISCIIFYIFDKCNYILFRHIIIQKNSYLCVPFIRTQYIKK